MRLLKSITYSQRKNKTCLNGLLTVLCPSVAANESVTTEYNYKRECYIRLQRTGTFLAVRAGLKRSGQKSVVFGTTSPMQCGCVVIGTHC